MTEIDLDAILTRYLERFDDAFKDADEDSAVSIDEITGDMIGTSMSCEFALILSDSTEDKPVVEARAHIHPGGRVGEATLNVEWRGETASADLEPGSGMHRALQAEFTYMWDTWDETVDETPEAPMEISAADVVAGDILCRWSLTVTAVEATTVSGQPFVIFDYEETSRLGVWPADQMMTVLREEAPQLEAADE